ncbi:glycine betaine/proline transport system substrate-binding protein [Limimonas halophila]|uniref:Glycine betaine/proline transport system substrate-binding protein n=1 Tax=Limimonas halophila TaxID=1082479 RepID=A0A1G7R800_9PROT|nr:glycine betaine ABC transporter substrate-binding protein [Limimonas halophila]SDG06857.1 glycine betaine/proline transport system substrate-binding protein [Limimonas halophila]
MKRGILFAVTMAATVSVSATASAQDAEELAKDFKCDTVRFAQPPWTGVSIKTETAAWMLKKLGYEVENTTASLAVSYKAMAGDDVDTMLSQWFPSARSMFRPFGIQGKLDIVSPNLTGGTYTLAVPDYVYEAGVKSIEDLDEYKDRFGGQIYGIDHGSTGNDTVKSLIKDDYAGLGDWELTPSSEAGMLSALANHTQDEEWIVHLAWAPHPMNINHDIKYLEGAAEYWGPNKGEVIVQTVTREGYAWACPNVGQFLDNYDWTVDEQSLAMEYVQNQEMEALAAGKRMIRENPEMLDRWFDRSGIYQTGGITTLNGEKAAKPIIAKAVKE